MDSNEHTISDFEGQLRLLGQRYTPGEVEHVEHLLRREPVLVTLLLAVYPHILQYFPDAQVFLHAVDDPESPPWQGEGPNGHNE